MHLFLFGGWLNQRLSCASVMVMCSEPFYSDLLHILDSFKQILVPPLLPESSDIRLDKMFYCR